MATIPNIFNGNNQAIPKPFLPAKTAYPQCGFVTNMYYTGGRLSEATINVAGLLSSMPVKVLNDTTPTSGGYAGGALDPKAFNITQKATTLAEVSAFVLETESDVVPVEGGESIPLLGGFVKIARLGSKIRMYLPCDNSLIGKDMNAKINYDFANGVLTLGTTDGLPGVVMTSAVVDGKVKKINATSGLAEWVDTKCVEVEL